MPQPVAVQNLANVTAVDAGNTSAYALEADGSVWAWGQNFDGQLGDGVTEASEAAAVRVALPAGVTIKALGEAQNSGNGIDTTGHAWAWGLRGPNCNSGGIPALVPEQVRGISHAVAVQGGEHHTVWLLEDGTVETCGVNTVGQLGVTGVTFAGSPVAVPGVTGVVEVSAGERTTCARTASGAVYDWGADNHGQIGNGIFTEAVFTPYRVPLPGAATAISCGGNLFGNGHALAVVGGAVYGWGNDQFGQVGDGHTSDKSSPVATGLHFTQVAASGVASYGIDAAGNAWSWGSHNAGDLGTGSKLNAFTPELIAEGVSQVSGTAHDAIELQR